MCVCKLTGRSTPADFLIHGLRALRGGGVTWKLLNCSFAAIKLSNQRQHCVPREFQKLVPPIEDLKYVEVVLPTKIQLNSPTWLVQK